jgi:hypothetical protein
MTTMEGFFKRLSLDPELNPKRVKRQEQPGTEMTNRKDALKILMGGRLGKKAKTGSDADADADADRAAAAAMEASFQPAQMPSLSQNSRMVQAVEAALRDVPVALWVGKEVEAWTSAALAKGIECRANAVERAMDGIMHVFGASEHLDFAWSDKLALSIPWGLQAIFHELLTEKHGVASPKVDVAALNYGKERNWDDLDQQVLFHAMKQRYRECMDDIRHELLKASQQQQSGGAIASLGAAAGAGAPNQPSQAGCASDRHRRSSASLATSSTPSGTVPNGTTPPGTGPTPLTRPNMVVDVVEELKFLENMDDDSGDSEW